MGLNAKVMCNCYKHGRVTEPPFSRELLALDDSGELWLNVSWENEELHNAFDLWLAAGCEHFLQQYVEVWLGTWGGVRTCKNTFLELGRSALADLVPEVNGGRISPEQAATALREMEDLFQSEQHATEAVQKLTGFVDALRTVCRASVETGNPVIWF